MRISLIGVQPATIAMRPSQQFSGNIGEPVFVQAGAQLLGQGIIKDAGWVEITGDEPVVASSLAAPVIEALVGQRQISFPTGGQRSVSRLLSCRAAAVSAGRQSATSNFQRARASCDALSYEAEDPKRLSCVIKLTPLWAAADEMRKQVAAMRGQAVAAGVSTLLTGNLSAPPPPPSAVQRASQQVTGPVGELVTCVADPRGVICA